MDGSQQGAPREAAPLGAYRAGVEQRRVVTGVSTAAAVLISLAVVRELLVTVGNWRLYFVAHEYLAGRATAADLLATDSDALTRLVSWPSFLLWVLAGVVFLVWLWRARINAELTGGAAAHRRARGWVVGGWVTPVVNLWIPYQVVSDIWRMSTPRRPASDALVKAWWAVFVTGNVLIRPIQWSMSSKLDSEQALLSNADVSTLLSALYLSAGVLLILIIRRVTAWQTQGRAGRPTEGTGP